MEFICFIPGENVAKAEAALKSDFQLASRQSITIRAAESLDLDDKGSFFYITGSEEGVTKCKELLKDFIAESKNLETVKTKISEESENAASGMGSIFG
jgi:hypothetical protein